MKKRGLLFRDEESALAQFQMLSYFRLANYLRPMENNIELHTFKANSYFEDGLNIYYFDKELRTLVFTAIQSIEIAIRSRIIDRISMKYGAFWFADANVAVNAHLFQENLAHIKKELSRSREDFISNHFAKYDTPEFPPVWKTLEIVTFGTLSKLYTNLSDNHTRIQVNNATD